MSPNLSTGPRTEEGKARSSQNALKTGLFSAHGFVLESERDEYDRTYAALRTELRPDGVFEETYFSEIMTATWRLRRCRLVETSLGSNEDVQPEDLDRTQKSIDRARAAAHTILRRSLAELRRLQSERVPVEPPELSIFDQFAIQDRLLGMQTPSTFSSFCNPANATARNALCPCGSGSKFKRCCGKDAPPVLNNAAA